MSEIEVIVADIIDEALGMSTPELELYRRELAKGLKAIDGALGRRGRGKLRAGSKQFTIDAFVCTRIADVDEWEVREVERGDREWTLPGSLSEGEVRGVVDQLRRERVVSSERGREEGRRAQARLMREALMMTDGEEVMKDWGWTEEQDGTVRGVGW